MEKYLIELPSIRDDNNGYNYLFKLANVILSNPLRHFDFNFRNCSVLDQNAVAMLGGLARFVDLQNSKNNNRILNYVVPEMVQKCGVMFQVDSMSQIISQQLIENNFLSHFSRESFSGYPIGDYIGYRQHLDFLDSSEIAMHLSEHWLSDEKVMLAEDLKEAVVSRIIEIFMNAYGHSYKGNNNQVLVSCGQYLKKEKKIKLTVLDFGCGIIENVKSHFNKKIQDDDAMKWALLSGNSTKTDSINLDMPRGLGFGLLSEFATVNEGVLRVFSNSCEAKATGNNLYSVSKMKTPFNGTLVNISINCDGRHYSFVSETSNEKQYF